MKGLVEGARQGAGSDASFEWIPNSFLEAHGVTEGQFPLYEPPTGETAGFHRCNISRALSKGITFRPIAETARATFEWYKSLPAEIQPKVAPQFARSDKSESWLEKEKALLDLWRKDQKKK